MSLLNGFNGQQVAGHRLGLPPTSLKPQRASRMGSAQSAAQQPQAVAQPAGYQPAQQWSQPSAAGYAPQSYGQQPQASTAPSQGHAAHAYPAQHTPSYGGLSANPDPYAPSFEPYNRRTAQPRAQQPQAPHQSISRKRHRRVRLMRRTAMARRTRAGARHNSRSAQSGRAAAVGRRSRRQRAGSTPAAICSSQLSSPLSRLAPRRPTAISRPPIRASTRSSRRLSDWSQGQPAPARRPACTHHGSIRAMTTPIRTATTRWALPSQPAVNSNRVTPTKTVRTTKSKSRAAAAAR